MVNENKILEEEKISKLLLKFSVPCIMGLLISAFYNIVDQIFIGNSTLGYLGNAATGVSFPVICIANAFAWCVGDGAASYLSICAGRKDTDSAHKSVGTGITVTLLISIVLMLICEIAAVPLMNLFGASDQTLGLSVTYFRIVAAFFPFYLLLNVMNSMIRADGSPAFAMKAMVMGAIINIILDPIFIFLLKWGIAGAAWATIIGQFFSAMLVLGYLPKFHTVKLSLQDFMPKPRFLKMVMALGAAACFNQLAIFVTQIVMNNVLRYYGALSIYGSDIPLAVVGVGSKVNMVFLSIVIGISQGAQPIIGFNYGAAQYSRVKKTYRLAATVATIIAVIAFAGFQIFPRQITALFGSGDELYEQFAVSYFRIFMFCTFLNGIQPLTANFFTSIGKAPMGIFISMTRQIIFLIPLVLLLPLAFGIEGVMFAGPISDGVAGVLAIILVLRQFKKMPAEGQAN